MTRKTKLVLGFLIVAFLIFAIFTGGIVVSDVADFGGQRNIKLVPGLRSDIWLAPESTSGGVPLFQYYSAGKPFGLRLQIWDESLQYRETEITDIVLEYFDGEVIRSDGKWSRSLKPYMQQNSSSGGIIQTEMFMLSDQIEGLVLRHVDITITFKGHLTEANGNRHQFSVSETFKAQSRFDVSTFWDAVAGC